MRDVLTATEAHRAVQSVRSGVKERTPEWYALNRVDHALWALADQPPPDEPARIDQTAAVAKAASDLCALNEQRRIISRAREATERLLAAKPNHDWSNDECQALADLCKLLGVELP